MIITELRLETSEIDDIGIARYRKAQAILRDAKRELEKIAPGVSLKTTIAPASRAPMIGDDAPW